MDAIQMYPVPATVTTTRRSRQPVQDQPEATPMPVARVDKPVVTQELPSFRTAAEWMDFIREMAFRRTGGPPAGFEVVQGQTSSNVVSVKFAGLQMTLQVSDGETIFSVGADGPIDFYGLSFMIGGVLMEMERRS